MKKLKILIPLVIIIGGGLYFLLFFDNGKETEAAGTDNVEVVDSVPEEPEEVIDPVERVRQEEMANPTKYLSLNYTSKKNIAGKINVEGSVSNGAGLAIFKDIQLKVVFLNKLGTEMGSEYLMLDEYVDPGNSINFEQKYKAPKGSTEASVILESAKPVMEVDTDAE